MPRSIAPGSRGGKRGSALLAVLATVTVLGAVAFALGSAARSGMERAAARRDLSRAYFLARGGIEAALHELALQAGTSSAGKQVLRYEYESGTVEVTAISDAGKLDVNRVGSATLAALLTTLGAEPGRASALAKGIAAYRSDLRAGWPRRFSPAPKLSGERRELSSFERRQASIQAVEELLSVEGVTPDLVYGAYRPKESGSPGLRRAPGLAALLRTDGPAAVDVNAAPSEVLSAAGISASMAARIVAARARNPLRPGDPLLAQAARSASGVALVAAGETTSWSLTATARLGGPRRAVRTVAASAAVEAGRDRLRIRRWRERAL